MSFGQSFADLYAAFQAKYDLVPGFGGDFDLSGLFGDWRDDPAFVRDRVCVLIIRSYRVEYTFNLVVSPDNGDHVIPVRPGQPAIDQSVHLYRVCTRS